MMQLAVILFK